MLRSMFSGVSGLKNFQTKLDVIGNNIANVNTYGFKKGRVVFKDLYSQKVASASAPEPGRGGTNSKQVGLGSQIAAIDTIHNTGSMQFTGNTLDLSIEGDGFFRVYAGELQPPTDPDDPIGSMPDTDGEDLERYYTRMGVFYLDENGYLVDGEGRYLLGEPTLGGATPPDPSDYTIKPIVIPKEATDIAIDQTGKVTFKDTDGKIQEAGNIPLFKFSNPSGLEKVGGNLFVESSNSGLPEGNRAGQPGYGSIKSGSLEMSNVDLSEEFTEMIIAQRGFQANTRIITTSDEILQELVNLKR